MLVVGPREKTKGPRRVREGEKEVVTMEASRGEKEQRASMEEWPTISPEPR